MTGSPKILEKTFPHIYHCGDLSVRAASWESQDELAECYLRMKRENLLHIYFQQGEPSLVHFLELLLKPGSLTCICQCTGLDIQGLGHCTTPIKMGGNHSKADVSMMFFRRTHPDTTLTLAQMMIEMTFSIFTPPVTTLCGCTPVKNRPACKFVDRMGFKRLSEPLDDYTTWHGEPCACYMSVMTRKRWAEVSMFAENAKQSQSHDLIGI